MAINIEDDWNNMVLDLKHDIKIDFKNSENDLPVMRSQGWIDSSAESVWQLVNYGPMRQKWDANVDVISYLSREGLGAYTLYNKTA